MIPNCLQLDVRQRCLLDAWTKKVDERIGEPIGDFDSCECASFTTWEVYATGLGDVIIAKYRGHEIHVEYDDDEENIGEEFFRANFDPNYRWEGNKT